jgi:hypothetical protein
MTPAVADVAVYRAHLTARDDANPPTNKYADHNINPTHQRTHHHHQPQPINAPTTTQLNPSSTTPSIN